MKQDMQIMTKQENMIDKLCLELEEFLIRISTVNERIRGIGIELFGPEPEKNESYDPKQNLKRPGSIFKAQDEIALMHMKISELEDSISYLENSLRGES